MDRLINGILAKGLVVEIGHHAGDLVGYYATVCDPKTAEECPECEHQGSMDWDNAGHGVTPEDALINAEEIFYGISNPSKFGDYHA